MCFFNVLMWKWILDLQFSSESLIFSDYSDDADEKEKISEVLSSAIISDSRQKNPENPFNPDPDKHTAHILHLTSYKKTHLHISTSAY
jgi:hypothetical protein